MTGLERLEILKRTFSRRVNELAGRVVNGEFRSVFDLTPEQAEEAALQAAEEMADTLRSAKRNRTIRSKGKAGA